MADYSPARRTPSAGAAAIGPGYYAVLGLPRDASNKTMRDAHARALDEMKTELDYEEATEKTKAAKEARKLELQRALDTLCDLRSRYKHDVKHGIWNATWTVERYKLVAAGLLDSWVAEKDDRVTSGGVAWGAPASRYT